MPDNASARDKWESFWNKIVTSLDNLVTLQITTSVGALPTIDKDGNIIPGRAGQMMRSRINMVQGDVITEIDPAFVTGELKELREFHMKREAEGHAIVERNIAALRSLVAFAVQAGQSAQQAGSAAGQSLAAQKALPGDGATTAGGGAVTPVTRTTGSVPVVPPRTT